MMIVNDYPLAYFDESFARSTVKSETIKAQIIHSNMDLVGLNQWFPNSAPRILWDPRTSSRVIRGYISVMVTLKWTYNLN